MVPGHEIVGKVKQVGSKVTKFQPGDHVGVGCLVDSCLECKHCKVGDEQYCENGNVLTYNGTALYSRAGPKGSITYGGYSDRFVVHEHFAVKIPKEMDLSKAAPLLCAGITMYDPQVYFGVGPDKHVAVMGLGGLGVLGVRIAKALGAKVTVLSSSPNKKDKALQMGADDFIAISDPEQVQSPSQKNSLDLILNTVSAPHQVNDIISNLLATNGKIICIGIVGEPYQLSTTPMIFGRKGIHGSLIGGLPRTQEMIDFCFKHGIYPEVETLPASPEKVSNVLKTLNSKNDLPMRYVIDTTTFRSE